MDDESFMRLALEEAQQALSHDDVPIGAVIVRDGEVLASARNQREALRDPTAHAEVLALRAASQELGSWRLSGTTMYVTLEPCAMCAGALVLARVERLVYALQDERAGAAYSLYNIVQDPRLNHQMQVTPDVLPGPSLELLQTFFQIRR